jgi:colanic acid biosynthesis glycosyl transferase WcaI
VTPTLRDRTDTGVSQSSLPIGVVAARGVSGARRPRTCACSHSVRVAYLTQWFPPEPVHVPLWIAESLQRQGLQVRVLTGVPNWPTGEVQDGYSALRAVDEYRNGFRVARAPLYPSHSRSADGRLANYGSHALSSCVFGRRLLGSADAALVYASPATAATAVMVSKTPYVLLVQDLWPDSIFATGFLTEGPARHLAKASLTWFTGQSYRQAAHVAVISPGIRDLLIERGVPAGKVSVVYNWADETVMRPAEPDREWRASLGFTDAFLLMYAGNHGAAQGLDVVLQAMGQLRNTSDIHLVQVGDGIEKCNLRLLAERIGIGSVHLHDVVAQERMPALKSSADLQLVSLRDQALFRLTMPSKLQSKLACAQPVLVCAPGDAARVVEASGAGFAASPGNATNLANMIRRAYETPRDRLHGMGRAGYAYYKSTMSEAVNAGALASLLRYASDQRRPVRGQQGRRSHGVDYGGYWLFRLDDGPASAAAGCRPGEGAQPGRSQAGRHASSRRRPPVPVLRGRRS